MITCYHRVAFIDTKNLKLCGYALFPDRTDAIDFLSSFRAAMAETPDASEMSPFHAEARPVSALEDNIHSAVVANIIELSDDCRMMYPSLRFNNPIYVKNPCFYDENFLDYDLNLWCEVHLAKISESENLVYEEPAPYETWAEPDTKPFERESLAEDNQLDPLPIKPMKRPILYIVKAL